MALVQPSLFPLCRPIFLFVSTKSSAGCARIGSILIADEAGDVVCVGSRSFLAVPSRSLGGSPIEPVNGVRDLGVFIDSDLGTATHVRRTVSRCFAALRYLRHLATSICYQWLLPFSCGVLCAF